MVVVMMCVGEVCNHTSYVCIFTGLYKIMLQYCMFLIISILALNSRDQHEKMATEFYVPQNTSLERLY